MSDFPDYDIMDEVTKRLDRTHNYRGKAAALTFAARQLALARLQMDEIKNKDERIAALKATIGDDLAAELLDQARLKQGPADEIDRALAELRRAATDRARTMGDQDIAKAIRAFAAQMSPASARAPLSLADDETLKQKTAAGLPGGLLGSVKGITDGSIEITDIRPR